IQSQALDTNIAALNNALASLGVSRLMEFDRIEAEQLQPGEDGVVQPPQNVLGLIGALMNPPMRDVSGNSFAKALSGVGRKHEEISQDMAELLQAKRRLAVLADECSVKELVKLDREFRGAIGDFDEANCGLMQDFCGSSDNEDRIADLISALNGMGSGLPGRRVYSLRSGLAGLCDEHRMRSYQVSRGLASEEKKAKAGLDAARAKFEQYNKINGEQKGFQFPDEKQCMYSSGSL